MLLAVLGLLLLSTSFVKSTTTTGTVHYDGHRYSLKHGYDSTGAANGNFSNTLDSTGWGEFKVETNRAYEDLVQMYAAGYLEGITFILRNFILLFRPFVTTSVISFVCQPLIMLGVLTSDRILQTSHNIYNIFFATTSPSKQVIDWLTQQEQWTRDHTKGPYNSLSTFWKGVAGIMAQYDGLIQGYLDAKGTNSSLPVSTQFAFQLLAGWGDMLDLVEALHPERRPNWAEMTLEEAQEKLLRKGHCSALVKILGDYSDLFMGQSAWFTYGAMNRIYKHYNFATSVAPRKLSFSSYPGSLASQDDFYMMDSGLVMLQTTNGILNATLYDAVDANALLAWQRVRLASHLATDGKTWCSIVATHNSGTYNNQYMVIDTKKFTPGQPLPDGLFWVAEQIPGKVEYGDLTNIVRFGYWPSYNVPYFPDIWYARYPVTK